jgi:hypothetical protein
MQDFAQGLLRVGPLNINLEQMDCSNLSLLTSPPHAPSNLIES